MFEAVFSVDTQTLPARRGAQTEEIYFTSAMLSKKYIERNYVNQKDKKKSFFILVAMS